MKKVQLITVCLVLVPVCAIGQGFYGTEVLTVPEMTGPTTLDGVLNGSDSWNSAFTPLWMSDYFDDEGIPGSASDISAQFSMGTYEGDLYIAVVVTDDIDNMNGTTWQRDGLEIHVNFENVLVDMSLGSGANAAENRKINFLENGAAQIRVIGGTNPMITVWPDGYPNAECQAVLDFARGRSGTTTTYEVVIKVSAMTDVSITGPFGFGIAVNDVDETNGSRVGAVAWWGGPQQPQGLYNAVIVTGASTIRPWQWTMNHASPTDLSYPQCTAFLAIPGQASNPNPADGATDMPRDVSLSWTPGAYVTGLSPKHKVFFSENFDGVNDGIGGVTQDPNVYPVGATLDLDFGKTYYWRVDEANNTTGWDPGRVWQFTVEQFAYPIAGENINATASSLLAEGTGPENTVNGSGLNADDLHSAEQTDMWLSSNEPLGAWIEYEFNNVYKLHEMWVWNSNQMVEPLVGFGLKDVTIEYSINGTDYTTLGTTHEFAQAPGRAGYAHNTTVDFGGAAAKHVKVTANSNWGGIVPQYSLSEVRFLYIPVHAIEPSPADGATDVSIGTIDKPTDTTLGFRAGREAEMHNVYLSTDEQAVIDGIAPVTTVTEASYGPLSLDLGQIYYWRVDEVNEAEIPTTWQGDIWNFATQEYFVLDDFEDYNDYPPDEIFSTWDDGYDDPANGALVANPEPPFAEAVIVHDGSQAMPYFYDNSVGYSEATVTMSSQRRDWTKRGIGSLSLWFRGHPASVGSFVEGPVGTYTMTGAGEDIWGTSDEFHFAYKTFSGTGSIIAKVESVEPIHNWAKAGVMIRDTLDPNSTHVMMIVTPAAGVAFQRRTATGDSTTGSTRAGISAPQWVKIERDMAGNIKASFAPDGSTWTTIVGEMIPMSTPMYIGLALTSNVPDLTCEAIFSNVQITGASGPWINHDIGILSNASEPMYVALANTGGTPAAVYHDDPNATQIGTWTEWNIDLKQFSDQGVNLANVNKISLGFGDKNNPHAGTSGKMYFDDFRLHPLREP